MDFESSGDTELGESWYLYNPRTRKQVNWVTRSGGESPLGTQVLELRDLGRRRIGERSLKRERERGENEKRKT